MIQAMHNQLATPIERPHTQGSSPVGNFEELFGDATKTATEGTSQSATATTPAASGSTSTPATLGEPDVQGWLTSYYTEMAATNPLMSPLEANVPFQPASGATNNYSSGSVYGPDQVFTQAVYNQNGYCFASLTGQNPSNFMSQLPGIPTQAAQKEYDTILALTNAQRLATGQPIDTAAYWSDPGSVSYDAVTYTAQELGYAGPGQSWVPNRSLSRRAISLRARIRSRCRVTAVR